MYLKKLIITNFKTFTGAKELIFSKGYTVLSGPNGSGKSNTLDAILFVLGRSDERVKKTVAEVISKDFNTNKLLADYADVTLVFSNNDSHNTGDNGEDIIVSRQIRIPSSGKAYSVYKLNEKDSSLGEILKTLPIMDYNIVKQGEITSRMYETPESRRILIEQIAGLAELDPLITESSAKIVNSRETLKRIGFLLKKAKAQLEELEKEKGRTLNYRELEGELKKYKALKIYSTKLELIARLDEIDNQIEDKAEEISQLEEKISDLKQEIDRIDKQIAQLMQEKQKFETKKTEISITYEMDLKKIEEFDQRLDELKQLMTALEERVSKIQSDLKKSNADKQKILKKMKKSLDEQNVILNQIKELQFENTNLELTLPRLKEKVNELDLKRTELYNQVKEKENATREIDSQIRELRQKRINLEERIEEMTELQQEQTAILGKAKRELSNFEGQIKVNSQRIEKYKQEIIINRQVLEKQAYTFQENELKRINLQNEIQRYQTLLEEAKPNYSLAVQRVLEAREKKEIKGVVGTVIELIENIIPDYAIAIEAAGGAKLQNIVTEDFDITKDIINYIKKFNVGKITFYPLDVLQDWQLKPTPNDQKIIGKIIDLIKFDREKYQRVMNNIFKNTLIVQDLDAAKKYRAFRAVTKDGDLVEPGGWVTTRGKFEPRFLLIKEFYRKKIGNLRDEYEELTTMSKNLENDRLKLENENKTKQMKLEELVDSKSMAKGRIIELQKRVKDLASDLSKGQNEFEKLNSLLLETKAEEQNAHVQLAQLLEDLENLNKEKEAVDIAIAETELGKTEKQIDANRREIYKLRDEHRKFDKEREMFNTQITQIDSNITLRSSRLEDLENRITQELMKEKISVMTKRNEFLAKIESGNNQLNTILQNMTNIDGRIAEKRKEYSGYENTIRAHTVSIDQCKNYINEELQARKIRIEVRIQEAEEKIEKLGLEITEDFEIDLERINQEIDRLELEISALGLIDHQAPEKYEAENTRLNELLIKKTDYERELEEALGTKEDLLTQKKLKFLSTIADMNKHLDEIFVKLYGKGHATLIILNKANPLESGVDIEVDVGSGTVDYIGTLSGGEKSMVALAFIFAIQKYQSASIYFLDEIDSYLDDTHCEALGRLLKDLSRDSQYIVITPRMNALITYADRIYGVWLEGGTTEIVCQHAEDFASMGES